MSRGPKVARWAKDGQWHITEAYVPTESDRAMFSVSYPPGDPGPFFVWSQDSFDTEAEARKALEAQS